MKIELFGSSDFNLLLVRYKALTEWISHSRPKRAYLTPLMEKPPDVSILQAL